MSDCSRHWLDRLEDLTRPFASERSAPVCFLIGAGASLSSGAPTTSEVISSLRDVRPNRFQTSDAVYAGVHEISADDRIAAIDPLFRRVAPYIGYRCLAAIGRSQPVIVVNLNWDDCVSAACERLVMRDYMSVDVVDVPQAEAALGTLLSRGHGVLCVYVHGRLNDSESRGVRLGFTETLTFKRDEFEFLRSCFAYQTIVVGTSLEGPRDTLDLIRAMWDDAAPSRDVHRLWVVERGREQSFPDWDSERGARLYAALFGRQSRHNYVSSADVDFDLFMVALRAASVGYEWDDVRHETEISLTAHTELVPPHPPVLRPLLDEQRVLLVGRPRIGSSSVAHVLAHWRAILDDPPRRVLSWQGAPATADEIEALSPRARRHQHVVVLDHCFGDRHDKQSAVFDEWLNSSTDAEPLVATSSPQAWRDAVERRPELTETVRSVSLQPEELWSIRALRAYARRRAPRDHADVVDRIQRRELTTPDQVNRALDALPPDSAEEQYIEDLANHLALLRERSPAEALLVALVRLQSLSTVQTAADLKEVAGTGSEAVIYDPWDVIMRYHLDAECLRLTGASALEGVDRWLRADYAWVMRLLGSAGERARWALEALEHWDVLNRLMPTAVEVRMLPVAQCELFGSELVDRSLNRSPEHSPEIIDVLIEQASDSWALRDVALTVITHWTGLRDRSGHDLIQKILADETRRGVYGALEGVLRRGGSAPLDLWMPIGAALVGLLRSTSDQTTGAASSRRQLALCFDAFLWRNSAVEAAERRKVLQELLRVGERDPILESAYAAAVAYHLDGARELRDLGLRNPLDDLGRVSEDEAREMSWIVAWHFIDQSRNRALASRRDFSSTRRTIVNGNPRYLNREPSEHRLDSDAITGVHRVVRELARRPETAGWAVHLVMNLHATTGRFDEPLLVDAVERAPDDDPGLISAAITYRPRPEVQRLLEKRLRGVGCRRALLAGLGEGFRLDGTVVSSPRFLTTSRPWKVRARWQINSTMPDGSQFREGDHWRVLARWRSAREVAIATGAPSETVDALLSRLIHGDTRHIDLAMTRPSPSPRGASGDLEFSAILAAAAYELEREARPEPLELFSE